MVKLYADRGLQSPLGDINLGVVEVGTEKTEIYYIFNDTNAELHDFNILYPKGKPEGLEILLPKAIEPNGTGELVVTWKPSLKLRKALLVEIKVTYSEVYIAGK